MLREILAEFARAHAPLCAGDVSRCLGLETRAVEGMLETLVRAGRLVEVSSLDGCCNCPVRGGCVTMQLGGGRLYRLPAAKTVAAIYPT